MIRSATGLTLLLLTLSCAPPAPPAPAAIRLYALDCGRLHVDDAAIFSDEHAYDGQARDLVDPCYLIRHPSGDLIWDTGLPEAINAMPNSTFEAPPFRMSVPTKLSAQLEQLGVPPDQIEFVSVSHGHGDHAGNLGLFTHATWIVDADERAVLFSDQARASSDFANYSAMEQVQTRLIEGDGDTDVFGDGSVTIIQAPGHTPGHTVLLVKLAHAGPILLTGDLYHMAEARERRTVPVFNTDRAQTLASMDKIEALASATGARVIRQHVPEDFAALPHFPEALD